MLHWLKKFSVPIFLDLWRELVVSGWTGNLVFNLKKYSLFCFFESLILGNPIIHCLKGPFTFLDNFGILKIWLFLRPQYLWKVGLYRWKANKLFILLWNYWNKWIVPLIKRFCFCRIQLSKNFSKIQKLWEKFCEKY